MLTYIKLLRLIFDKKYGKKIAKVLIEKELTLSTAESCTGGLISSLLTDISGSSAFIKCNFVTYANEAKIKYLGVKKDTLEQFGAVSHQTAYEMAKGILENTNSDFSLATTGIAGPSGGTKEKPVGLIYIGIGKKSNNEIKVFKFNTNPHYPRVLIKYIFAQHALRLLANNMEETNQ